MDIPQHYRVCTMKILLPSVDNVAELLYTPPSLKTLASFALCASVPAEQLNKLLASVPADIRAHIEHMKAGRMLSPELLTYIEVKDRSEAFRKCGVTKINVGNFSEFPLALNEPQFDLYPPKFLLHVCAFARFLFRANEEVSLENKEVVSFSCAYRYPVFLQLQSDHPNEFIIPPLDVSVIWLAHFLQSHEYTEFIGKYFPVLMNLSHSIIRLADAGVSEHYSEKNSAANNAVLKSFQEKSRALWNSTVWKIIREFSDHSSNNDTVNKSRSSDAKNSSSAETENFAEKIPAYWRYEFSGALRSADERFGYPNHEILDHLPTPFVVIADRNWIRQFSSVISVLLNNTSNNNNNSTNNTTPSSSSSSSSNNTNNNNQNSTHTNSNISSFNLDRFNFSSKDNFDKAFSQPALKFISLENTNTNNNTNNNTYNTTVTREEAMKISEKLFENEENRLREEQQRLNNANNINIIVPSSSSSSSSSHINPDTSDNINNYNNNSGNTTTNNNTEKFPVKIAISLHDKHSLLRRYLLRSLVGYQRFFFLMAKNPTKMEELNFNPCPAIDLIWHTHLLQPSEFMRFSRRLVGKIHHHKLLPQHKRTVFTYTNSKRDGDRIWREEFAESQALYLTFPGTESSAAQQRNCDLCSRVITHRRFHCQICEDVSLCAACVQKPNETFPKEHKSTHMMLEFRVWN